jgi:hypothetical protein
MSLLLNLVNDIALKAKVESKVIVIIIEAKIEFNVNDTVVEDKAAGTAINHTVINDPVAKIIKPTKKDNRQISRTDIPYETSLYLSQFKIDTKYTNEQLINTFKNTFDSDILPQ